MTPTKCRQRDCLCFHVKRERMDAANEIYCIADITDPRQQWCEHYRAPSWKPWPQKRSHR